MADTQQVCTELWNYTDVVIAEDMLVKLKWSGTDKIILAYIVPFICVVGILMNFAFLFTVASVRRMQTVTNMYLVNLSIADILFMTFTLGSYLHTYLNSKLRNNLPYHTDFGCWGNVYPIYLSYYASILIVTLVSLERFFMICMPIKHRLINGKVRTAKLIAACWGLSLILAALTTPRFGKLEKKCIMWPDTQDFVALPDEFRSCYLVSNVWALASEIIQTLMFVTALFTSCATYYKLVKTLHQKTAPIGRRRSSRGDREHRSKQERNQIARLLIINGVVFFLCQFPARVINLDKVVRVINDNLQENFATLFAIANGFLLINSAINPIIYGLSSRFYRVAFCEAFGIAAFMKMERQRSLSRSNESFDVNPDGSIKRNNSKSCESLNRILDSPKIKRDGSLPYHINEPKNITAVESKT